MARFSVLVRISSQLCGTCAAPLVFHAPMKALKNTATQSSYTPRSSASTTGDVSGSKIPSELRISISVEFPVMVPWAQMSPAMSALRVPQPHRTIALLLRRKPPASAAREPSQALASTFSHPCPVSLTCRRMSTWLGGVSWKGRPFPQEAAEAITRISDPETPVRVPGHGRLRVDDAQLKIILQELDGGGRVPGATVDVHTVNVWCYLQHAAPAVLVHVGE